MIASNRRWRTFAATVVLVLAGAELALRNPQLRGMLPPRTHYYHPLIAQKLDAIDRLLAARRGVDVLFVGSSIVLTNVHPVVFDDAVQAEAPITSFNAGLPGLWPSSVALYLERVWLPRARPRVVVQGIRYAELAATTHAKNASQVWSGSVEAAWRPADLQTRVYSALVDSVYLLQYRGAFNRALASYRSGWITGLKPDHTLRGYHPRLERDARGAAEWEEDLPNDGTCEEGGCNVGLIALRRSAAAAHAAGATYVLVNIPEHAGRWFSPDASDRYRTYLETLRRFAESERIAFVDPTDGSFDRFAHASYSDYSHMTDEGSRLFTRLLAGRMTALVPRREGVSRIVASR